MATPIGMEQEGFDAQKSQSPLLSPPKIGLEPEGFDENKHRDFLTPARTREAIYASVLNAAKTLKPVQNTRHTLEIADVDYADEGNFTIEQQKKALLTGATLGRRLVGTWRLKDNATGKVLEERKQTLARVPFYTDRGTVINKGTEYSVVNQMRLRPGIFTRVKDNGEIEAHVNVLPGNGVSHRIYLEPETGVFYANVGQAKIPALPMLEALGVNQKQLTEAWGPEIANANITAKKGDSLAKFYKRMLSTRERQEEPDMTKALAKAIRRMKLDPEVTGSTLGKPYEYLDADVILDTTKKLLAISRGEQETDDRDHMAYQQVLGPEDLFAERLTKDYGGLQRQLLYKASFAGGLKPLQPGILNKQLESVLFKSGLASAAEEINPSELLDKLGKVSRMGEGSITSTDSVPDEARAVQPSHFGLIDPVRTPESLKLGVDVNFANAIRKGPNGTIFTSIKNIETGKIEWMTPQQMAKVAIAFPGELNRKSKRVGALKNGKIGFTARDEVKYVLPHFENAFSPLANMVPMKSASKAQRMAMAARMTSQALPLEEPDAPLVQTGIPDSDDSFENKYGEFMGAVKAKQGGRVISVKPNMISVKYEDGTKADIELYQSFPLNRKTVFSQQTLVKPGDTFAPGQILARSNYTDKNGVTALGKNLRVGYLAYKGFNFEDAIVISESAAKKLSSQHGYQYQFESLPEHKTGLKNFVSLFPGKYTKDQLKAFDDSGVVKPGTIVNYGDPLILAAQKKEFAHNKILKGKSSAFGDASIFWDHHTPGVVRDVVKQGRLSTALVETIVPTQVGDKLSGRWGDKGVLSGVIPDDKMPRGADGEPLEVLLNPLGIISRVNTSQIFEAALGKIAAKTGKAYKIQDFESIEDLAEFVNKELKKHGIEDLEDVIDPETETKIPGVLVGNRFLMKLHHTAESKLQGRSTGGYSSDDTPAKGGTEGAKRVALLENNALLSHGAHAVLRDASLVRGQRNEQYWANFIQGNPPPPPKIPLVYDKFVADLKGSGINVVRDGRKMHIMALTEKDIDELAGERYIKNGETVKFEKGLEPVKGGLFDPEITGGHNASRWARIKLTEPMPNPVMEEPIRRLLGLTEKQFQDVLAGRMETKYGSGPAGIKNALESINLDKEIEYAREQIRSGKKTYRDVAIRKLGYLKSAKSLGIHPKDWMLNSVPVIPPRFRPVSVMGDKKLPLVSDPNYLYKELIEANQNLKDLSSISDDVSEERLATYNAFKAVTGLGDPVHPKLIEKNVKGLLKTVLGSSPKTGTLQRKLLSATVDVTGRGVIAPNPDLDMDQIAIPEDMAWSLYDKFIVRRLKRRGMPVTEAIKQVQDRTKLAKSEMLEEMNFRPVITSRAPVWHKFGIMAFYPRLTKENVIQVNPLTVHGFTADFDGDAQNMHVPVDDDARKQAVEKLLPSRNLISPADFKKPMHGPTQEYTGGLYAATAFRNKKEVRRFRSIQDMRAALADGRLQINDPVEIIG